MELSLNALAEDAEQFLGALAAARHRQLSGLGARTRLARLIEDAPPALFRTETFLQVRQTAESSRTDAQTQASAQRVLRFLAWAHRLSAAAPSLDGCADALDESITSSMRTMTLADGLDRLAEDRERERRHLLERDVSDALWERQTAWARVIDANIHSSARLGFSSVRAQHDALTKVELETWLTAAQALLTRTEDAYRDLLGYVLKRLDSQLKPQGARWHDLLHGCTAPWMRELFREEDLLPAINRTFDELHLPLRSGLLDAEPREGRAPGAHVCVMRVPDDVRLAVTRRGGRHSFAALLGAGAEASLWSRGPGSVAVIERRFPEPVTVHAVRQLFADFALEEGWLKRFLRLPSAAAREAARLGAFATLTQLRQSAALLPYALELYERGPGRALAEEYEDRMARALAVAVPRGGFLVQAIDGVAPEQLGASTLAVGWGEELRERFNEDYFRNPATGGWFSQLATTVGVSTQRPAAADLAKAGQRLVRLMGT